MKPLKITALLVLLAFFAFNIAFADVSFEERLAAKKAILAEELSTNSLEPLLPGTDDVLQYCSSCYTNTTDDYITNVTFNTINNNTGAEGAPCSYGDYTAISTDVIINQTYTLTVTFYSEGTWTEYVRVWLDWNQNEIFENDETYYLGSGIDATLMADIAIPLTASPGPTRMRVIEQWNVDPGVAGACDGQGSHSTTYGETEDYTVNILGAGDPGALMGTVTDLQMNPIDGAEVTVSSYSYTTGPDGAYFFELYPLTYSATASAEFHNPITIDNIVIVENETTTVDFALPTPLINVVTDEVNLQVDSGEVITVTRNVSNVGDGELDFNVEIAIGSAIFSVNPSQGQLIENTPDPYGRTDVSPYSHSGGNQPVITDYRDSLFAYLIQDATGDDGCLGVEFDGTYFWVTGRNAAGGDVHKLHKFDRDGNLIQSYDQGTTSTWGWRDLAWDGEYLYASDENELAQIDPAIGQKIATLPMPSGLSPVRALAYDPATDHFWSANFSSNIYEFDRNGTIINQYANSKAVYGMAWDDVSDGGPYLWVNSQDGTPLIQVSQFNPATGTYTGETWQSNLPTGHTDALAGGAAFTTEWDPSVGALVVLGQGTPTDFIYGYEIAPFSQWLTVDPMSGILHSPTC